MQVKVTDRWHLMENANAAFLDVILNPIRRHSVKTANWMREQVFLAVAVWRRFCERSRACRKRFRSGVMGSKYLPIR